MTKIELERIGSQKINFIQRQLFHSLKNGIAISSINLGIPAIFALISVEISEDISKSWMRNLLQPLNQEKVMFIWQKIFFSSVENKPLFEFKI